MIKYNNIYLIIIKVLLFMIFSLLSIYYLFVFSPNVDFIVIFIYFILLSFASYKFFKSKYILFSKSELGEELLIFSKSRPLDYKNTIFWAVATSSAYSIFLSNISFDNFEMINSQVLNFSVLLLVISFNFVLLFESMIESSTGIYKEGILMKKFIKWEEIIGYKTVKNRVFIKIKNRNFGLENNYLTPLSNGEDLTELKNLLKENISEPLHPNKIFGWSFFSRLHMRCNCILLA